MTRHGRTQYRADTKTPDTGDECTVDNTDDQFLRVGDLTQFLGEVDWRLGDPGGLGTRRVRRVKGALRGVRG